MVANGDQIQVVEHESGNDITAVTLSQIIVEHEKKGQGVLSQGILTRMVQTGEETMNHWKKRIFSRLGFEDYLNGEIIRRIRYLEQMSKLAPDEIDNLIKMLTSELPDSVRAIDETKFEISPETPILHSEIEQLIFQVEKLTQEVDQLKTTKFKKGSS